MADKPMLLLWGIPPGVGGDFEEAIRSEGAMTPLYSPFVRGDEIFFDNGVGEILTGWWRHQLIPGDPTARRL